MSSAEVDPQLCEDEETNSLHDEEDSNGDEDIVSTGIEPGNY